MDARWFISHLTRTFLSFCCPAADSSDEFVLTQNAYSIFEGPNEEHQWTDWHVFAPISPHITIIMRKNVLQEFPLPELESSRQKALKSMLSICFDDSTAAQSSLIDLPLERPQTSYPTVYSGKKSVHEVFSNTDTFTFRFVRLCSDHFQRINSIFLEEALETKGVIFQSQEGFKRALEAYFVLDPIRFKQVASNSKMSAHSSANLAFGLEKNEWILANRENYLKLLEKAAAQLGSSVEARYFDQNGMFFNWIRSMPENFLRRYGLLGRSFTIPLREHELTTSRRQYSYLHTRPRPSECHHEIGDWDRCYDAEHGPRVRARCSTTPYRVTGRSTCKKIVVTSATVESESKSTI